MNKWILIGTVLFLFNSCRVTNSSGQQTQDNCTTPATVRDFKGLDGCTFLLVLDSGKKILPVLGDIQFVFWDGQQVLIEYRQTDEMLMSICMAEDMIADMLCIKQVPQSDCMDTRDPQQVNWMVRQIQLFNPVRVSRYSDQEKWSYLFEGKSSYRLFDCQGIVKWEMQAEQAVPFTRQLGSQLEVIWTGESIKE